MCFFRFENKKAFQSNDYCPLPEILCSIVNKFECVGGGGENYTVRCTFNNFNMSKGEGWNHLQRLTWALYGRGRGVVWCPGHEGTLL